MVGVDEWLRVVRGAGARWSLGRLQGLPRSRVVECDAVEPYGGRGLLCRGSWWRPPGVLGFVDIVEEDYLPLYTGPVWLEAGPGGLVVDCLDARLAASGGRPRRLLVRGYAGPEEITGPGAGVLELGAVEYLGGLERWDPEPAARLMAAAAGCLLLRRYALPAPATWAPEAGAWLRARDWGWEAERLIVYVSPSWQPFAGPAPGMAVAPAAVYEIGPGAVLLRAGGGWALRL